MLQAVAFGMGSGLLHKVNRDTMSFATKLSHIAYTDGHEADIMKHPTAGGKDSFPGLPHNRRCSARFTGTNSFAETHS